MFDPRPADHDTPGGVGAQLGAAVDALARVCLDTAGDETLLGLLRELEVAKHRLAALDAVIVAQVHARGLAGPRACASTAALLAQLLRVHPREAAGRVRAAQELGPRRALTGQTLDPVFPAVADALSAGRISARHASVIIRTVDALPEPVAAAQDRAVEQFLVSEAERCNPAQLGVLARRIADTLDPDGTPSLGWRCTMINGTPHWTPPSWLDPTQTPRPNNAHHTAADLGWAKVTDATEIVTNCVPGWSVSGYWQPAPVRGVPDRR